jgi:hypothetical protein
MAGAKGYEFTAGENEIIFELARTMRFVAMFQAAAGAVFVFAGIALLGGGSTTSIAVLMGQGALNVLVSGWMLAAARHFQRVVGTRGQDVTHMMGALSQLRRMYDLQKLLVFVTIAVFAAGLAAGLLA